MIDELGLETFLSYDDGEAADDFIAEGSQEDIENTVRQALREIFANL